MRVLIAIKDRQTLRSMTEILQGHDIGVEVSPSREAMMRALSQKTFDVAVVDINYLGRTKGETCDLVSSMRVDSPVLLVVPEIARFEQLKLLDVGADQYVFMPFTDRELLLRVRAAAAHLSFVRQQVTELNEVTVSIEQSVIRRDGKPMNISPQERALLEVLLQARGEVVAYDDLMAKVRGPSTNLSKSALRVAVLSLRRKLGDPTIISTVTGVGYRIPMVVNRKHPVKVSRWA